LVGPGSGYTSTKTGNITKKIYKNTLRGNSAKIIDKILPGKYKAVVGIPAIAVGAYLATRKPKDVAADKGKITYKKVEKPLGFDTGRKINQDRISYNQFLKKNNITDPQQKTLLAKQKERSDNAAARARRNSSKPTQKSMKNLS